ncbi:GTP1/OBG-domain containing protein [Nitzschia inconspicua]|uniref:GTP1/OBG-domain containing protein n=1 Tax=Nitzschia inconspicua TaxID=303405 RepID=A0A9K3KTB3_9STRA|nr:GTP1/OBG-domain containing protein [Nitzschia inconspicua]
MFGRRLLVSELRFLCDPSWRRFHSSIVSFNNNSNNIVISQLKYSHDPSNCILFRPVPQTIGKSPVHLSKRSSSSGSSSNSKSKNQKQRGRQSYRFIDQTRVRVSGGVGGNGSLSMYKIGRKHKKRPDGGHGGNGGSVVILADPNEQSLKWTQPHVIANAGSHGGNQEKHGRNGKNVILRVPCGVVVRRVLEPDEYWDFEKQQAQKLVQTYGTTSGDTYDDALNEELRAWQEERDDANKPQINDSDRRAGGYLASNDYDSDDEDDDLDFNDDNYYFNGNDDPDEDEYSYEHLPQAPDLSFTPWGEREKVEIADLNEPGSFIVVARGGRGGVGKSIFASRHGPLPPPHVLSQYAKPRNGETAMLELELKMIADIGLVGLPNAGKSSLLSAVSRASPYIAPYPFTTLNPLVGYIEYQDGFRVCAADIPGLIAGASEGRGRGHQFLRHLERTKALLYIMDAAAMDGRDPIEDFQTLLNELSAYGNGDLLNRKCLVVANKMDLLLKEERKEIIGLLQEKAVESGILMETNVLGISAGATGEGLAQLTKAIRNAVSQNKQ